MPLVQAQTRQTVRLSMALAGLAATAALAGEARWAPLHLFLPGPATEVVPDLLASLGPR